MLCVNVAVIDSGQPASKKAKKTAKLCWPALQLTVNSDGTVYLTLPYNVGQVYYRLMLRYLVGPVLIPT